MRSPCSALQQLCDLVQSTWFCGALRSILIILPCRWIGEHWERLYKVTYNCESCCYEQPIRCCQHAVKEMLGPRALLYWSGQPVTWLLILFIFLRFYLFEGKGRRKRGTETCARETLTSCLSHTPNWPATQACALTRVWTCDLPVHRPELNPLSHTSQGTWLLILTLLY